MPYFYGAIYQIGHVHKAVIADSEEAARKLLLAGRGVVIGFPNMTGDVMNVDHIQPGFDTAAEKIWGVDALKEMKGEV